ncbi:S8 family serine peptidase [Pengzhenrongella sp.]|uniref:RCC1 domain-containing protein n=1 Tax=Pengzhenrongella sp. TaxID=2888820 RepID=UPI002F9350ED
MVLRSRRRGPSAAMGSVVLASLLTVTVGPVAEASTGAWTAASYAASSSAIGVQPAPERTYIVRFKAGADAPEEAQAAAVDGARVTATLTHVFPGMVARLTSIEAAVLRADPTVDAVEADAPIHAYETQPGAPWGLDRIDQRPLPLSSTYTYDPAGHSVKAYVIDTGVRAGHADFGGRVIAGYSAVPDGRGTADCHGHGTHVAGTIAGARYGVAKRATIVPVRVLDCWGGGTTAQVIAGMEWVVANHRAGDPAVANMSLGGDRSPSIDAAATALVRDGVTLVVAAGNSASDACQFSPADTPTALTVAASTRQDRQADFSNAGPCVDLYAPGEDITSDWYTSPTATNTISGTSMASPHVAGAAASVLSKHPTWTPAQVGARLLRDATANAIGNATADTPNRLVFTQPFEIERFITRAYRDLFDRAPDPGGLAGWSAALRSGTPRVAVANSITSSTEYRGRLVREAYDHYLGRAPEPGAVASWTDGMRRGMTIQNVSGALLASAEHYAGSGATNRDWVRGLFQDVLGRTPGNAEVEYWVARLGAPDGSRYRVALAFLSSTEHLGTVLDGYYRNLLDRGVDPGGRLAWVSRVQAGARLEAVIGRLVASDEYSDRVPVVDRLVITPASATIVSGGSQAYLVEAFDAYGFSMGDVTTSTTFAADGDAACAGATCSPTEVGDHTVTATRGGFTVEAALHVTAAGRTLLRSYGWGYNADGELGDGTTANRSDPVETGVDTHWESVVAGGFHTVGIKTDGTLWARGWNAYGELGDGTTVDRQASVRVGSDTHWASVSAGAVTTVAIKDTGTLWAWGANDLGQLGDGTTVDRSAPVRVGAGSDWVSASAGDQHTLAIRADHTLWAWGSNANGQLGDRSTTARSAPVRVGTDADWAAVSAGEQVTAAIKIDGSLWAWGADGSGQLGNGTTSEAARTSPLRVGSDVDWASVSVGGGHVLAVRTDGTLWAWGADDAGQLGDGTTSEVPRSTPAQVGTGSDWASAAAGGLHSVALRTDGTIWAWGWNHLGQLGDGTTDDRSVPTQVGTDTGWVMVSAGIAHTVAARP